MECDSPNRSLQSQVDTPPPPPPAGLQPASPDRVNREASRSEFHDSAVSSKISQFNSLSSQSRNSIERRHVKETTVRESHKENRDANALQRAIIAREEADAEIKKYRDEMRSLKREAADGVERERKLEQKLDEMMSQHTRAKEQFAHSRELWVKEIRRQRKESLETSSTTIRIQEELKTARESLKISQESLAREKERSKAREQEAFTARCDVVGVQEELDRACEQIKVIEAERDSFRAIAEKEEVARIAAEGLVALPPSGPEDEFATPRKHRRDPPAPERTPANLEKPRNKATERVKRFHGGRVSISTMDIVSSEASEMEIEELTRQVTWERQRADRAQEVLDFMQMECELRCCPCIKELRKEEKQRQEEEEARLDREEEERVRLEVENLRREREQAARELEMTESAVSGGQHPAGASEDEDVIQASQQRDDNGDGSISLPFSAPGPPSFLSARVSPGLIFPEPRSDQLAPSIDLVETQRLNHNKVSKASNNDTTHNSNMHYSFSGSIDSDDVRDDKSSVYRQISSYRPSPTVNDAPPAKRSRHAPLFGGPEHIGHNNRHPPAPPHSTTPENPHHDRSPSIETPRFAIFNKDRVSLASLLDAPHASQDGIYSDNSLAGIPTVPDNAASANIIYPEPEIRTEIPSFEDDSFVNARVSSGHDKQPSSIETITTTTKVPLREETSERNLTDFMRGHLRSSGTNSECSFDKSNPAMTPTMTREQALAQIRQRRDRARSAITAHGTPKMQLSAGIKKPNQSAGPIRQPQREGSASSASGSGIGNSATPRPSSRAQGRTVAKARLKWEAIVAELDGPDCGEKRRRVSQTPSRPRKKRVWRRTRRRNG